MEGDRAWRDFMDGILTYNNNLDNNVETDAVDGSVDCVSRDMVV